MVDKTSTPSARQTELLELAYAYACQHGLSDLSLRPLAAAIGSSTRVLMFLFGTKEELVRAVLARARADQLSLLDQLQGTSANTHEGLENVAERLWEWLSSEDHRMLLRLWVEGYARSLVDPNGAWAGFARASVEDWLTALAAAQPPRERDSATGTARRRAVLALLRGGLLDLLATGELEHTTVAIHTQLDLIRLQER